jgi:hypothetical protein
VIWQGGDDPNDGHRLKAQRRQSAFDRWWSGPKGAYLMDYTDCSLLVARNVVSDEAIETALLASGQTKD